MSPWPPLTYPFTYEEKNLFKCPYCLITRHWFKDNSRHTYLLGCIHLRCILRKFYRKMRASCFSICPQKTLSLIMHLCQVSHWQNRKPSEPKGSILASVVGYRALALSVLVSTGEGILDSVLECWLSSLGSAGLVWGIGWEVHVVA